MSDNERDAQQSEEIHPVPGRTGIPADPAVRLAEAAARLALGQGPDERYGYLWEKYLPEVNQVLDKVLEARRRDTADVDRDPQDDAVQWAHTFVRGGTDKTVTAVDSDPQGNAVKRVEQ